MDINSWRWKIAEPNDGEAMIDIPLEFLNTKAKDPIEAIWKELMRYYRGAG